MIFSNCYKELTWSFLVLANEDRIVLNLNECRIPGHAAALTFFVVILLHRTCQHSAAAADDGEWISVIDDDFGRPAENEIVQIEWLEN